MVRLDEEHCDHTSQMFATGSGIADQDRNIYSNQLMIMGFLKSAVGLLAPGEAPSTAASTKRKRLGNDGDNDSDHAELRGRAPEEPTRGTILITLRNAPPYTLWYA
jgi:25S rRNA (uracil2634-N3)-methyltransferase